MSKKARSGERAVACRGVGNECRTASGSVAMPAVIVVVPFIRRMVTR